MSSYCLSLTFAFLLWVVPINIRAPKFVVFLSLVFSNLTFLHAFTQAGSISDQQWYQKQKKIQEREILLHDIALEELALKQALELQYFPQAEPEKEAIELVEQQQKLANPPEPKLLTDALPDHLKAIIQAAYENGGSIKHREAMRAKGLSNKYKAEEMKTFFIDLQNRGWGRVSGDGKSYTFTLSRNP